jgi:hypothetical protein
MTYATANVWLRGAKRLRLDLKFQCFPSPIGLWGGRYGISGMHVLFETVQLVKLEESWEIRLSLAAFQETKIAFCERVGN